MFSTRSSMLLSTPKGRPIAKRAAKKEAEASYVAIRASTFLFQLCLIAQIICCRSVCSALCCAKPPTASALLGGARCFFRSLQKLQQKKRPPKGGLSDLLYGFNLTEGLNYLLPFRVAVFVAASHVISVTPRAVARSLIGRNVLPSTTSGEEEAGIAEPLTLITFAPTVIVMIL